MAETAVNVRMALSGTAENVVLVRELLAGIGRATLLVQSDLNDIRTAVTEACNNVVVHAYGGDPGELEVELGLGRDKLEVVVRDHGVGLQTQLDGTHDARSSGIGLHVIRTLSTGVEFGDVSEGGTEVTMRFEASGARPLSEADCERAEPAALAPEDPAMVSIEIAPVALTRAVLPRLISALAARAHFSTDRIADAQLLADALAAGVETAVSEDRLRLSLGAESHDLKLRLAPLGFGRARALIDDFALAGTRGVIAKLADCHEVRDAGAYETLTLSLNDHRRV